MSTTTFPPAAAACRSAAAAADPATFHTSAACCATSGAAGGTSRELSHSSNSSAARRATTPLSLHPCRAHSSSAEQKAPASCRPRLGGLHTCPIATIPQWMRAGAGSMPSPPSSLG